MSVSHIHSSPLTDEHTPNSPLGDMSILNNYNNKKKNNNNNNNNNNIIVSIALTGLLYSVSFIVLFGAVNCVTVSVTTH